MDKQKTYARVFLMLNSYSYVYEWAPRHFRADVCFNERLLRPAVSAEALSVSHAYNVYLKWALAPTQSTASVWVFFDDEDFYESQFEGNPYWSCIGTQSSYFTKDARFSFTASDTKVIKTSATSPAVVYDFATGQVILEGASGTITQVHDAESNAERIYCITNFGYRAFVDDQEITSHLAAIEQQLSQQPDFCQLPTQLPSQIANFDENDLIWTARGVVILGPQPVQHNYVSENHNTLVTLFRDQEDERIYAIRITPDDVRKLVVLDTLQPDESATPIEFASHFDLTGRYFLMTYALYPVPDMTTVHLFVDATLNNPQGGGGDVGIG